jgi:acetyl-CoA acetyltransferase
MSVRGQYAIGGFGFTDQGINLGITARDLRADAIDRALEDAGLDRDAIDGYIHCWVDREDLRYLGLSPNFSLQLQSGGATPGISIFTAMGMIATGQAECVACVYGFAPSEGYLRGQSFKNIGGMGYGYPSLYGMVGAASAHALHARKHMDLYGTTSEHMGAVAVQQRAYAVNRPGTLGYGKPLTLPEHQASPLVTDPFRRYDCTRDTDGGACLLVMSAERAKSLKSKPVYILGGGTGHNIANWHNGSIFEHHDNIAPAKARAFAMAGMTIDNIDVAQVYDAFTIGVIMQLEEYGFCKVGQGGPFVAEGGMGPGGAIPTNTGGGQLSAFYTAGFTPLAEAIWQLRGDAGAGQLPNVNVALVSGHGLNAGVQNTWAHASVILGNEP